MSFVQSHDLWWTAPFDRGPEDRPQPHLVNIVRHGLTHLAVAGPACVGVGLDIEGARRDLVQVFRAEGFEVIAQMPLAPPGVHG